VHRAPRKKLLFSCHRNAHGKHLFRTMPRESEPVLS
jgi:hypothetical protein